MKYQFPKEFFWGAATSAHQVEGGNHNDWSEWEQRRDKGIGTRVKKENFPKHILDASPSPLDPNNYISGQACDHYNRFQEDFDIAKSLGHNAHRFSIEWSRIEPEEGIWNEKEIAHYQKVVNALLERGIEPFVTLWHWTLPLWVAKQGGWENKKTIADFTRYAEKITSSLSDVKFWITLNEPDLWVWNSYIKGIWPPQKKSLRYIVVMCNLVRAHKKVFEMIHKEEGVCVGIAKNIVFFEGFFAPIAKKFSNDYFLNKIKNHQDFIGLNFYFHRKLSLTWKMNTPSPNPPPRVSGEGERRENILSSGGGGFSDMGWKICPEGIYHLLKDLKKYKKPIYITENGIADAKDIKRAEFIKEHIKWIARAMKEGVDVRGYLYWSLLDNFEWDKGFWPRFGLVEMDYKTMERKIRQSAYEYKKIIEENSVEL